MGRLDRYIGAALLKGWLLVWVLMSAIFSLSRLALPEGQKGSQQMEPQDQG